MRNDIHETDPLGAFTALVLCCLALVYFAILGFGFRWLATVGLPAALRAAVVGF